MRIERVPELGLDPSQADGLAQCHRCSALAGVLKSTACKFGANTMKALSPVSSKCSAFFFVVLVAAGGVGAQGAYAQVVVNDPPHTVIGGLNEANNYAGLTAQIKEYAQTGMRWKSTWDHYQQQLATITSLAKSLRNIQAPGTQKLSTIPEDFGVYETCGGGSSWSLGALKASITSALTKNIPGSYANMVVEQRKICAMTRVLENIKYNASVEYVNSTLPSVSSGFKKLLDTFGGKLTQGNQDQFQSDLAANTAEVARLNGEFRAKMEGYDAYIHALNGHQQTLATLMLRGSKASGGVEAVGAAIQTLALAEALDVDLESIMP